MMSSRKKERVSSEQDDHLSLMEAEGGSEAELSLSEYSYCSDDECEESPLPDQEVQIDFEARGVLEIDFHGIHRLLRQLFLKAHIDLSDFTSLILEQNNIGSVIKTVISEEEEMDQEREGAKDDEDSESEALSITTVVDLASTQHTCVPQVKEFLLAHSSKYSTGADHQKLTELLSSSTDQTGLVIHERFLNLPTQIGPMLLNTLINDMDKVKNMKFSHLLIVTRTHIAESKPTTSGQKRKRKGASAGQLTRKYGHIVFDYPEIEGLHEISDLKFNYPVLDECDLVLGGSWGFEDTAMTPQRTVFHVTTEQFLHSVKTAAAAFETETQ